MHGHIKHINNISDDTGISLDDLLKALEGSLTADRSKYNSTKGKHIVRTEKTTSMVEFLLNSQNGGEISDLIVNVYTNNTDQKNMLIKETVRFNKALLELSDQLGTVDIIDVENLGVGSKYSSTPNTNTAVLDDGDTTILDLFKNVLALKFPTNRIFKT